MLLLILCLFLDSRKAVEDLSLRPHPCPEGIQLHQKKKMEGNLWYTTISRTTRLPLHQKLGVKNLRLP